VLHRLAAYDLDQWTHRSYIIMRTQTHVRARGDRLLNLDS